MPVERVDVENLFLYNGDSPKGAGVGGIAVEKGNFIDSCFQAPMGVIQRWGFWV
jgi:hypothetical protein